MTYLTKVKLRAVQLIFICCVSVSGVYGQLRMEVAQNILIPGESIWYGITSSAENDPYVYVTLYNADGIIIENNIHQFKESILTAYHDIPLGLKPGSYVLTASIRDDYNYEVLEEQSHILHILGDSDDKYFSFGQCSDNSLSIDNNDQNSIPLESHFLTRNEVCELESNEGKFISVVHEDLNQYRSVSTYSSGKPGGNELKTRFAIDGESTGSWLALYDYPNRKVHIADINEVNGEFLVTSSQFSKDQNLQAVNAYSGQKLNLLERKEPVPRWKCSDLKSIQFDMEIKNRVLKRSENRLLINQIFKTEPQNVVAAKEELKSDSAEPDRLIKVKSYETFESVELFLDEAISAIKLIKKKNQRDIVLVHGDRRGFFSDTPLIIIDGKIESDVDSLLAIPFSDLETIMIYRTKEKMDSQFGIMGRNGVLIAETKHLGSQTIHNIVVNGPEEGEVYVSSKVTTPMNHRPSMSGIQFFGLNTKNRFCYDHNDETGTFLLKSIDITKAQNQTKTYSYQVKIRQSQ